MPHAGDDRDHGVGRDGHEDRGRGQHQERRGAPGHLLGAQGPERHQHRGGGRRGEHGDDDAGGEVAAEPEPHEPDEEQQRPRRVAGDVGGPVVGGGVRDPVDVGRRAGWGRRRPRGRSAGTRTGCRATRDDARGPVDERQRRAATPGSRRTTRAAAGATAAARPGRRRTASPGRAISDRRQGAGAEQLRPPQPVQRRDLVRGGVARGAGGDLPVEQCGAPNATRSRTTVTTTPTQAARGAAEVGTVPTLGARPAGEAAGRRHEFVRRQNRIRDLGPAYRR